MLFKRGVTRVLAMRLVLTFAFSFHLIASLSQKSCLAHEAQVPGAQGREAARLTLARRACACGILSKRSFRSSCTHIKSTLLHICPTVVRIRLPELSPHAALETCGGQE